MEAPIGMVPLGRRSNETRTSRRRGFTLPSSRRLVFLDCVAGWLHPGFGLTRYFEPVAARAYTAISSGRSISGSETSLE